MGIICAIKGHDWRENVQVHWDIENEIERICKRCGKTKKTYGKISKT